MSPIGWAPLTHDSPTVNLNIRIPIESDQKITARAIRSLPLPELENASIIARDGAPPLLISVKTNYIREPIFHTMSEYVLYRVFDANSPNRYPFCRHG